MRIEGIIWLRQIVDKISAKHGVEPMEVEEVFDNKPKIRFVEKGERKGENVYEALGQTEAGRYLVVLSIYKRSKDALILSARNMARRSLGYMQRSKSKNARGKRSISDLIDWFDHNDTGDHLSQMPEANFEINIKRRRHLVALESDLAATVSKIAKAKKISSASLINSWVRERISTADRSRQ